MSFADKQQPGNEAAMVAEMVAAGIPRRTIAEATGVSETRLWRLTRGSLQPSAPEAQAVRRFYRTRVSQGGTVAGAPLNGKLGSMAPKR